MSVANTKRDFRMPIGMQCCSCLIPFFVAYLRHADPVVVIFSTDMYSPE